METNRSQRLPIVGLGIHNENAPPTKTHRAEKSATGIAAAGPRKALANVSNAKRPVSDLDSKKAEHGAEKLIKRAPLRPKSSNTLGPRPTASAPNLNAVKQPQKNVTRHAHRIYVDEPANNNNNSTDPVAVYLDNAATHIQNDVGQARQLATAQILPAVHPGHIANQADPNSWENSSDLSLDDDDDEYDQLDDIADHVRLEAAAPEEISESENSSDQDELANVAQLEAELEGYRSSATLSPSVTSAASVSTDEDQEPSVFTGTLDDVVFNDRVNRELASAKEWAAQSQDDVLEEFCDYSMAPEYCDQIFPYMRKLEAQMRPSPIYMENQTEIAWPMRTVLVDWLVQVHYRFGLLPETLFLAINIVDRFLSVKVVSIGKLQLVGATALLIASKYEEITCPSLPDMVFMVDNEYPPEEILKAERFMLSMLHFELGWPGPMSFLRRISKADDYDWETRTLAKYFLEITIMDARFVSCRPSLLAAASHCLSRLMLSKGDWSLAHTYYSQYTYEQLRPTVTTILDCCRKPRQHHGSVFEKYSSTRYSRASLFVEAELKAGFGLPPVVTLTLSVQREEDGARARYGDVPGETPTDENAPPSAISATSVQSCTSWSGAVEAFPAPASAKHYPAHSAQADRKRRR